MKDAFVKISSIILAIIFFNIALNSNEIGSILFGAIAGILAVGFAVYLLFEKKLKNTFPVIENNIFNKPISNKPYHSNFTFGTLIFFTLGSYFVLFACVYGEIIGENIFGYFWVTKVFYHLLVTLFFVASLYLTFLLVQFFTGKGKLN